MQYPTVVCLTVQRPALVPEAKALRAAKREAMQAQALEQWHTDLAVASRGKRVL